MVVPKVTVVDEIDGRREITGKEVKVRIYFTLSIILDRLLTSVFFYTPIETCDGKLSSQIQMK